MTISPKLVQRLEGRVRRRNRELAGEAALKASLGMVFTVITFGLLFWIGWVVGWFIARPLNLVPWQFSALLTGLFLTVAIWSAWRRVNPLAGLKPLTDTQWLLTMISQASPDILYFSPRHATAGAAYILIAGPANVFSALGLWAHRIPTGGSVIENASHLLASCQTEFPVEEVRDPLAALVLRRLSLIKVVPKGVSVAFVVTEKGSAVLSGRKTGKGNGRNGGF